MGARITLIDGHPDPAPERFGRALVSAYAEGAAAAGHEVRRIDVAELDFPLLRTKQAFESGPPPEGLREAQAAIGWCQHLVILYPLWLGGMPALTRGCLEQVLRPGFAFTFRPSGHGWAKGLKGRSARVVVTMGMPALIYRWYFGAHSLKSLERNVLGFVGFDPVRETLIGNVEGLGDAGRRRWLERLRALGRSAR